MADKTKIKNPEHFAHACSLNSDISTKQCIEICRCLRYKNTNYAKNLLEDIIALKKPIPFRRFNMDMGHKAGMSAGRFPQKAAKQFLQLVKSVEANAQFKGLNASTLKITKILANKASVPVTGGRHRRSTKRTNIEIEVKEAGPKKEAKAKKENKKDEEKVKDVKTEEPKVKPETKVEVPQAQSNKVTGASATPPEQKKEIPIIKEEEKQELKQEEASEELKVEEPSASLEEAKPAEELLKKEETKTIETPNEEGEKQ